MLDASKALDNDKPGVGLSLIVIIIVRGVGLSLQIVWILDTYSDT